MKILVFALTIAAAALWSTTACATTPISDAEALAHDIDLVAEKFGWTTSQTAQMYQDQLSFHALADSLEDGHPDDFSSANCADAPDSSHTVYFKNAAPAAALTAIDASGLDVTVVQNVGKNAVEWNLQADDLADWLLENGYSDFVVTFDDVYSIEVVLPTGAPTPTFPPAISSDVIVLFEPGPLLDEQVDVHGGARLRDTTPNPQVVATSGWCVEADNGVRGIALAAHTPPGFDTYDDPVTGATESLTFRDEHLGRHGDLEWQTTTGAEEATFFADENNQLRNTRSVQGRFRRGDFTCVYGRVSNDRMCDVVLRTRVRDGRARRQVMADFGPTLDGDSGGGWSFGTKAQGVHRGLHGFRGRSLSIYSRANRIDNALNVDVCISP